MADNIQLAEGTSGKYARTDDLGSNIHAQAMKLIIGDENTDGGYVHKTNPLPMVRGYKLDSTLFPTLYSSAGLENGELVKNAAAAVFAINGVNTLSGPQYIQIHNASSIPADTAVPIYSIIVPPGNFSIFLPFGIYCSTGLVVCNSTTLATKTIGLANCMFYVHYIF